MIDQLLLVLIEASVRATILAALVGSLLWLLRVPRGAPRHIPWLIVLIAMVLMPVLQRFSPVLPAGSPKIPDVVHFIALPAVEPQSALLAPPAPAQHWRHQPR